MGVKKGGGAKGKGSGGKPKTGGGGGGTNPAPGPAPGGGGRSTPTPTLLPPPPLDAKGGGGSGGGGGTPHPADAAAIADTIAAVKPVWEEMGPAARSDLLSLPLADLEARASAAAAAEAEADAAEATSDEAAATYPVDAGGHAASSSRSSSAPSSISGEAGAGAGAAASLAPPTPDGAEAATLMPPGAIDTYDGDAAGAARALREGVARLRAARACGSRPDNGHGPSTPPPPLPSYKQWKWPPSGATFPDAASFRRFVVDTLIPPDLRQYLPPVDEPPPAPGGGDAPPPPPRTPESPAEAALRSRMTTLLSRIHAAQAGTGPLPSDVPKHEEAVEAARRAFAALKDSGKAGKAKGPSLPDPPPPINAAVPGGRDVNAALAADVLNILAGEHEFVYAPIAGPVAAWICASLPPNRRLTTPSDLAPEDLERMDPDDVVRVLDWVVERVDTLAGKVRNDADEIKEMEERAAAKRAKRAAGEAVDEDDDDDDDDAIGDVDLFTLDGPGTALTVTPAWLRHLSARVLGEDAQPRLAKPGEDPAQCGLTLEWVFGSIVSTAEKARDAAKRGLGGWVPTPEAAFDRLLHGLREQAAQDERIAGGRALLAEMLAARKAAAQLTDAGYDLRLSEKVRLDGTPLKVGEPQPPVPDDLPDEVCLAMARREEVLTRAKLAVLAGTRRRQERAVRAARAAHRTAEPEFERARRALEEVKASPRPPGASAGLHGHHGDRVERGGGVPHGRPAAGGGLAFRTAAEMERHKAAVAEAALADQVEAQSALAAAQSRAVATQRDFHAAAAALTRTEQELKQLGSWHNSVRCLVAQFEAVVGGGCPGDAVPAMQAAKLAPSVAAPPPAGTSPGVPGQHVWAHPSAARLREHFLNDVRKQLYTTVDDVQLFNGVRQELATATAAKADGAAALAHVEAALSHLACDDPGARIGAALALPAIQSRLIAAANARAARLAAEHEAAVLKMVAADAAAEEAERERRARAKAKAKERERGARARAAAAAAEAEAEAERTRAEEEARLAAAAAAKAAERKAAAAAAKAAEEAMLAARREELMSGTDAESAHWRARAAAAAAEAAVRRGDAASFLVDEGAAAAGAASLAPGTPTGAGSGGGRAAGPPKPKPAQPPRLADLITDAGAAAAFGSGAAAAAGGAAAASTSVGGPRTPGAAADGPGTAPASLLASTTLRATAAPFVPTTPGGRPPPPPPPPPPRPARLPLPRGLVNATGRNNCFLNAVIQGLAACPAVPAALARIEADDALRAAGGPAADVRVLGALRTVLASLAARPPPPPTTAAADAAPAADGGVASSSDLVHLPTDAAEGARVAAAVAAGRPGTEAQPAPPSVRRAPTPREAASAVNPAPLRDALGALGGAATGCEASDMADAAEVLGELLASVHRAEAPAVVLGSSAAGERGTAAAATAATADPLLPTRRTVPAGATPPPAAPRTAAVRLFGMEIALPAAPVDGAGPAAGKRSTGGEPDAFQPAGGSKARRGSAVSNGSASASPPAVQPGTVAAEGGGEGPPAHRGDSEGGAPTPPPPSSPATKPRHQSVLQFVKFFHLAPAAAVRSAGEKLVNAACAAALAGGPAPAFPAFEAVLAEAEAVVNGGCSGNGRSITDSGGSGSSGEGAAPEPSPSPSPSPAPTAASPGAPPPPIISAATLLARPAILTVALVWESARAPDKAIAAVTAAIGTTLDAGGVFGGGAPPGPRYALRAAVCYLGHHYHAYVRAGAPPGSSPDAGCWLLADDETVAPVGGWGDAVAAMRADRAQPCLLFYEELKA